MLLVASFEAVSPRAGAQEPTPTSPPVRTPPPRGTLLVRVVNDLDGDGRRDEGEPGLPGWQGRIGCSDALVRMPVTDDRGETRFETASDCASLELQFGWLPTSPAFVSFTVQAGARLEIEFLVRKVGDQVQRLAGDAIVDGFPAAATARVDAFVHGTSCGDGQVYAHWYSARYVLYILSAQDRPGCATDGEPVSLALDGRPAGNVAFAPGSSTELHLVAGPMPMWFGYPPPRGLTPQVYVGDVVCGEARKYTGGGFVPQNLHYVYVLPEALRPGCGAPGRVVTLRADGETLRSAPWQPGRAVLAVDRVPSPVPPRAGTGRLGEEAPAAALAGLAAAAMGALALRAGAGMALRRR